MSTLKADTITSKSAGGDLSLSGDAGGVVDIEANLKIGGTTGIPISELRAGTDGELITWNASGVASTVPVGSATNVLTSNGAGAVPTFQAAGGGAWAKVANSSGATNVASIEYTALGTKDVWMRIRGISSTSSAQGMRLQIAQGGSFVTSGTGYNASGALFEGPAAYVASDNAGQSTFHLTCGVSGVPATGDGVRDFTMDIHILNPGGTTEHKSILVDWMAGNDGRAYHQLVAGSFDANTTALSGFKVYGSGYNFDYSSYEIMELN